MPTIKIPRSFINIIESTLDMNGGRAKHFAEKFLSENFNDPNSWFVGIDLEEDEEVVKQCIKKYYFRSYNNKYDRQNYRNI